MDAYSFLRITFQFLRCALKISSCSPNTNNKQQMESRIRHGPDIRLLAEEEGFAVVGKIPSQVIQYIQNLLVTHHGTERSE